MGTGAIGLFVYDRVDAYIRIVFDNLLSKSQYVLNLSVKRKPAVCSAVLAVAAPFS